MIFFAEEVFTFNQTDFIVFNTINLANNLFIANIGDYTSNHVPTSLLLVCYEFVQMTYLKATWIADVKLIS